MASGRCFVFLLAVLLAVVFLAGCSTPQERSGHSLRPFNSPTAWETNPYYGVPLQN